MKNFLMESKLTKGVYKIKVEIDEEKNDFFRNSAGEIDEDIVDYYIDCKKGKIYYYGKVYGRPCTVCDETLTAYIPSIENGNKIISSFKKEATQNYYVEINDKEVFIFFNPIDITIMARLIEAKVRGKNVSPFDKSNLEK